MICSTFPETRPALLRIEMPLKKKILGASWPLFSVCLALLALTFPAQAYIDPGTGSLVVQAIIGGIIAAQLVLRKYWWKLKDLGARIFYRRPTPPPQ